MTSYVKLSQVDTLLDSDHDRFLKACYQRNTRDALNLMHENRVDAALYDSIWSFVCQQNDLEMAKWLASLGWNQLLRNLFFIEMCERGKLLMAKWFHSQGVEEIAIDDAYSLVLAKNPESRMAAWLSNI